MFGLLYRPDLLIPRPVFVVWGWVTCRLSFENYQQFGVLCFTVLWGGAACSLVDRSTFHKNLLHPSSGYKSKKKRKRRRPAEPVLLRRAVYRGSTHSGLRTESCIPCNRTDFPTLGLFFYPEERGSRFFRNGGAYLPSYTTSYLLRESS